jgi:hypothetical protein
MKEFIFKIMQTLKSNGFPEKRVSLPTEKMYEVADNKGLSFNVVLQELKANHNIDAEIGPEKIVFSQIIPIKQEDMLKQAQEMMSQMDPSELKKLQDMFMKMSPEEKEEILKRGKDLGLI